MVNLTTQELWLTAGRRGINNYKTELEQIAKMQNLSQNQLGQIAKMRHIKNYKNMSREELLLLKLKQSHAELYKSKSNNVETEETKKPINELRNKFSKSKIKKI